MIYVLCSLIFCRPLPPLQSTSVHSFALSPRRPQPRFRRKTASSATAQSNDIGDDDDLFETSPTTTTTSAAHTSTKISTKPCNDVYMSVHVSHEKVGCAVYDFKSGRVSLLEDCLVGSGFASRFQNQSVALDDDDDRECPSLITLDERNHSADVILSSTLRKGSIHDTRVTQCLCFSFEPLSARFAHYKQSMP